MRISFHRKEQWDLNCWPWLCIHVQRGNVSSRVFCVWRWGLRLGPLKIGRRLDEEVGIMGTYNYHGYKFGEPSAESQGGLTGVESDRGDPCPTCEGSGMEANTFQNCPPCGGCGYVMTDDPRKDKECPKCGGNPDHYRWEYLEPCPMCGGTGRNPLG